MYILAGCVLVPFHGDESTIIYMSRDYDTLFRRGDLAHILYRDPPPADDPQSATRQDLRLINGVVNKYLYGAIWSALGLTARDLNDQWLWGADLDFNRANGHVPSALLLFVCRLTSGLLTALSAAVIFVIGKRAGGRRTAYVAALLYTLTPAVLLNGRRAMMESALLLFGALLVYAGQRAARQLSIGHIAAIGIIAGLTVASKHTGLIVVFAVFGGVLLYQLLKQQPLLATLAASVLSVGGAALIGLLIFLALDAAWWSDPLGMPERVLGARQALLTGQVSAFGGFGTTQARVTTLFRESLSAAPQYYEATQGWPEWIGDQIRQYESAALTGLSGTWWSILLGILVVSGGVRLLMRWQDGSAFVVLVWSGLTLITVYVLTPLDWQRYYLPMAAPVALLGGMAFARERHT